MAVLGKEGRLELRREAADPCIIRPEDLNLGTGSFNVPCEGYWSGDRVVISGPEGLPIFIDGRPQRWESVATYRQGTVFVAENRDHITDNSSDFYKQAGNPNNDYFRGDAAYEDDNALFYYQGQDAYDEETVSLDGYICVDSLGRAKLYSTRCEGLACCGPGSLDFVENNNQYLDFDYFVINHYGSSEYQNAVTTCFGDIGEYVFNDIADDTAPDPNPSWASICANAPQYLQPEAGSIEFDNADVLPRSGVNQGPHPLWTLLMEVREWSLETDAPSVDVTGVGEKWGEGVKSLVTGGGSVEFFVDRKCYTEAQQEQASMYLMQLLLMTQMEGCKAQAKFFMFTRATDCDGNPIKECANHPETGHPQNRQIHGALWYETEILVTRSAVNTRPTELIAGTANFVTTGAINLRQGDPYPNDMQTNIITVTSSAFTNGQPIPTAFYFDQNVHNNQPICPGSNTSPQLEWTTNFSGIDTFRLRCVDLSNNDFVHWSVDSIPGTTLSIAQDGSWPTGAVINLTGWDPSPVRANGWGGPCQVTGTGVHTYRILIEALTTNGTVIGSGQLTFTATA